MASLFTARRKPKRVASADSREDNPQAEDGKSQTLTQPSPCFTVHDLTTFSS